MKNIRFISLALMAVLILNNSMAHGPKLHVSDKWRECSFQIDPSLTQEAWHQFAGEGGMVTYFRSLNDAKPMGAGRFEISVLQWNTKIDESTEAWNNTFVHPDSEHWLIGGEELPFPGLSLRAGISNKTDIGIYWSERPGANYGVIGGQLQHNFLNDTVKNWAVSARATFSMLYGPDDLDLNVYGADVLASKKFRVISNWAFISPYAGISTYLSHAHEKTDVVDLKDENIWGVQSMVGVNTQLSFVRIGAEYNFAQVNTFSYKLGFNFKF